MAKKKQTVPEIKPHTDYEESLIYMAYRYAIGRHTIHSHCMALDMIQNEYYRFKLNTERMIFTAKDINRSIEDCLRWSHNMYIENPYQVNNFPYEIYRTIQEKELALGRKFCKENIKRLSVSLDWHGNIQAYDLQYKDELIDKPYTYDMSVDDLDVWNMMAKLFDISQYEQCYLIDGTSCTYVRMWHDGMVYKVPVKEIVENPHRFRYIPDESIKTDIPDDTVDPGESISYN